jgi:hypothetical protein
MVIPGPAGSGADARGAGSGAGSPPQDASRAADASTRAQDPILPLFRRAPFIDSPPCWSIAGHLVVL